MFNAEEWADTSSPLSGRGQGRRTKGVMKNFAIAEIGCAMALLALLVTPGTANMDHKPALRLSAGSIAGNTKIINESPRSCFRIDSRGKCYVPVWSIGAAPDSSPAGVALPSLDTVCYADSAGNGFTDSPFAGTEKSWPADTFDISFAQVSFPSTVLLFGAGLLALVGFRKRFTK